MQNKILRYIYEKEISIFLALSSFFGLKVSKKHLYDLQKNVVEKI